MTDEPTLFDPALLSADSPRTAPPGKPAAARLQLARRGQVEMVELSLDERLPEDHRVRQVWAFVQGLDLSALLESIKAVEDHPGRPAIDPQILVALWLYATIEAVGTARELDRLCKESLPYQWLCGGVSVNYHTLADFRVEVGPVLDELLTSSVAAMMSADLVQLQCLAVDGMRVRAAAGAASFRRRPTLEDNLATARQHVQALAAELDRDPGAATRRQAAARQRAARERQERLQAALDQMPIIEAKKAKADKDKARVSTTDPDARIMKMSDGGYRPALNAILATDTESKVIVAASVVNAPDMGQLLPIVEQIKERHGRAPTNMLADGGFAKKDDIEQLSGPQFNTTVYAPVQVTKTDARQADQPHQRDSAPVAQWRARMASDQAKEIYKDRAATAELVNAQARNRGLTKFLVRGLRKTSAILLWYVLAHNMMCYWTLSQTAAAKASGA